MSFWTRTTATLAVTLAGSVASSSAVATAQSSTLSAVVVRPVHIHPGEPIWISGSGFPARQQVKEVYTACPDFMHDTTGTVNGVPGPYADGHGQFTAFAFRSTAISGVDRPVECTIYASVGNNPFEDVAPKFYLLPANQRLDRCDKVMCGIKISPRPRRVHSGVQEVIGIAGAWPGARANITVALPGYPPQHRTALLDWKGAGGVKVPVSVRWGTISVLQARVRVQVVLGSTAGNASGNFSIIR